MITFEEPLPFEEALAKLASKGLLPTDLSSAQIRRQWSAALRDRSLFSARTTKAEILQRVKDQLAELLDGKTNIATARMKVRQMYDELGYRPEEGFAGEEGLIPPSVRGAITDLSSNPRIDLMLTTNMRQVANFAFREQGQSDYSLYAWPCYELLRIYPRAVPRGMKMTKAGLEEVPGDDWPSRWEECGGEFYDGRMIARKDSDIWDALGSQFDDSLDTDIPPFAFNSGFGWVEISREEAIELGVIDENTDIQGSESDMNEGMETSNRFDPEFLKALEKDLDLEISAAKLSLAGNSSSFPNSIWERTCLGNSVASELQWFLEDELTRAFGWNEIDYHQRSVDGWVTRRLHMAFLNPDKESGAGRGSAGGGNPLDKEGPIQNAETAARYIKEHPDHPTSKAFETWFTHPSRVTEEQSRDIHKLLGRLPKFPADPSAPIYKGISCRTLAERDALVAQYKEDGKIPFDKLVNSASKSRGIAVEFSQRKGPGILLEIVKAKDSARDVGPLVKNLAPHYQSQQELIVLKGTRFSATLSKKSLSVSGKSVPVFTLRELQ